MGDDNSVAALVGFRRPQLVPFIGDPATAIDEDGNSYDATVVAVLPDSRVYLRLAMSSRHRYAPTLPPVYFREPTWVAH